MKLPIISKVAVDNLSLYTNPIDHVFFPGINMIIGGNGLGKTTLINTVLFGLVGNAPYERLNVRTGKVEQIPLVERDYFVGRLKPADQASATVTLTFGIGSKEVDIIRSLYHPHIIRFQSRDKDTDSVEVYEGDSDELEREYQAFMEQELDIGQFKHLVFLTAHLLVFGEDRRTLVWDTEAQNRIIRLLFLEREFDEKFEKLSQQVTSFDTSGRHKSETRKDINRFIEGWLRDKKEALASSSSPSEVERQQTELQIAEMRTEMDTLDEELASLEETLQSEMSQLRTLTAELDRLEVRKVPLVQELEESEDEFYSNVYKSVPVEYALILENLAQQGICQICGASGESLKELGQRRKEEGRCIVCGSPVYYSTEANDDDAETNLADRINLLRERLDSLEEEQKACVQAQSAANAEIARIQEIIAEKTRARRHVESSIAELRSRYLATTGGSMEDVLEADPWLAEQRRKVQRLTDQIDALYGKRDDARKALNRLNRQLTDVLHKVNEELTPLFSDFASKFLGMDCELVVSQRTRARKPITFMYPRFNNKDRERIEQVSESQRFFLDQAFRMALITWFVKLVGQPTLFIVETPEGSLDLAYERNVADMYFEFGSYGHSILVTSNLNSSDFLGGLYDRLGDEPADKQERTLDLLRLGQLSSVQQREEHLEAFNQRYEQLGLPII